MILDMLTEFFKWTTILNAALLVLSVLLITTQRSRIYRIHSKLFDLTEQQLNAFMYGFLGFYKILFLVFNLIPWLALLIITPCG